MSNPPPPPAGPAYPPPSGGYPPAAHPPGPAYPPPRSANPPLEPAYPAAEVGTSPPGSTPAYPRSLNTPPPVQDLPYAPPPAHRSSAGKSALISFGSVVGVFAVIVIIANIFYRM